MNGFQRVNGLALFALLASACTDESITDVSGEKGLNKLAPSFLVAGASVVVRFEPLEVTPWYLLGKIHLQDDWSSAGPYDHFVVNNTVPPTSYSYPSFGVQSLRISNAVTSGSFGDQTFSKRTFNYAGESESQCSIWCLAGTRQRHFEVEWDFASTTPAAVQTGLAVTASPDRGDGARMSFVRLRDTPSGLAVDFVDVQGVNRIPPACGQANFVEATAVASGLNRAVPHTIRLTMDLLEGPSNDIVRVYVDGSLRHTGTSWEDYYRFDCEAVAHLGMPPAVNRILYRTSSNPPVPTTLGLGFVFDNLSLGTSNAAVAKDDCKNGGWRSMTRADGSRFKNQGDCIQYTNTGT